MSVRGKEQPLVFSLGQNYPNPFNPITTMSLGISHSSSVILLVYDVLGREVATLVNERKEAGKYTVVWDASQYPSGVYFCRMQAGAFTQTRKLILIR
jgi:hypothetical protein